jgi:hypothetical protein
MPVAEIEAEHVRVGFLLEGPTVAARATRNIFMPVAIAVASAAIPPLPYRTYRNATDLGVLPI